MILRRTTTTDPEFRALTAQLDAEMRGTYGPELQDKYDPHNVLPELATALVALDAETPIACGCFRPFDPETIEIKRMFVVSDRRGHGIASAILGGLEAWARELGFHAAVLETGVRQPAAIALYRRRGYTEIAKYPPYVELATSICMRKPLG